MEYQFLKEESFSLRKTPTFQVLAFCFCVLDMGYCNLKKIFCGIKKKKKARQQNTSLVQLFHFTNRKTKAHKMNNSPIVTWLSSSLILPDLNSYKFIFNTKNSPVSAIEGGGEQQAVN